MKKIAIFVEGQTELIFTRELLLKVFDNSIISFSCFQLRIDGNLSLAPYNLHNPKARIYFQIINAGGNGNQVLYSIKKREQSLIAENYKKIIGLCDMYSDEYINKAGAREIKDSVTLCFINKVNQIIRKMNNPNKIKFHFAIMEIEAWFLVFYKIFEKIHKKLTVKFIQEKLGFNLADIDPEKKFFKPSKQLIGILKLINCKYDKSKNVTEKIVSKITVSEFEDILKSKKVSHFRDFYIEIDGVR